MSSSPPPPSSSGPSAGGSGNVKVVCRFRPQLDNELMRGGESIVAFDGSGKNVSINVRRSAKSRAESS
jgi:hypothetical protein